MKVNKFDLLILLLLTATFPLFFYKLGQSSLVSWDEAWYAEIARNILKSGDPLNLIWSGEPFFDHPPAGFWLITATFKVFGVNEFSARFPSALAGLGSLFILYFLGKALFGRVVGFASALALPSAFWFLYRSRSGNLDIILTMFFLLTLYMAIKSARDKRFLYPFSLCLGFLFLTKSLVPLTIIPAIIVIFWKTKTLKVRDFLLPSILFLVFVGSWFITQMTRDPYFTKRILEVGLPGIPTDASFSQVSLNAYRENFNVVKGYLHEGVGKWFWPGILSLILGLFLKERRFYILASFSIVFFVPFIFSSRVGIWHLIPLYPILILTSLGLLSLFLRKILKSKILVVLGVLAVSFYFSILQIRRAWYQFIDIPAYVSDEAILSREAGKYEEDLFIEGSDFRPTAVFYSGKNVPQRLSDGKLISLFESEKPFLLITYENNLDQLGISAKRYQILKKDRDKILVLKR
ncbi:MAG: glycosyltransferase family 39 protein [bacterium]|nr:glycosyltransferase family 39 protein [bacterium]